MYQHGIVDNGRYKDFGKPTQWILSHGEPAFVRREWEKAISKALSGTILIFGDLEKAARRFTGMASLFGEEEIPRVKVPRKPSGHLRIPTGPGVPKLPHAHPIPNFHSPSMEFEAEHPRAETNRVNPETGKEIRPGQFAPKPKTEDVTDRMRAVIEQEKPAAVPVEEKPAEEPAPMVGSIDLRTLVRWSEKNRVQTKQGPRDLQVGAPSERFWDLWRKHKDALKAAGIGCGKNLRGEWEVNWWHPVAVEPEKTAQEKAEARAQSRAESADIDIPHPPGLDYLPYQKAGIQYGMNHNNVLIADEMGLGKAQPLDAKLLTVNGWKLMGDIAIGDRVFGSDGLPHAVTGVFPQGIKEIFRVVFSDGSYTECCDEHLWSVRSANDKFLGKQWRVFPLADIRTHLKDASGNTRHYIPMAAPIAFPERDLCVDPYVLGALLGDGSLHAQNIIFTNADQDIIDEVNRLLPVVRLQLKPMKGYDYRLNGNENPVRRCLDTAGLRVLAHEKFVPDDYKFASIKQRESLLQGLMDTDGSVHSEGSVVEFCSTSERLADDVQFLVESLGGRAAKSSRVTSYRHKGERRQGRRSYRLNISFGPGIQPFRCKRKRDAFLPRTKYLPTRGIMSVESVGMKQAQCIMIDSPDHLYLTDHCIATHNTIQAIGIANADPDMKKILIIAPASLKINWQREWEKWDTKGLTVGIAGKDWPHGTDVVVVNYDILKKYKSQIDAQDWDMLISDEAHYLKSPDAQRTHAVLGGRTKANVVTAPIKAKRRIFLTGTPIVNRPAELWTLAHSLDREGLGASWTGFHTRYANAKKGRYGWDISGASNLGELQDKLRETFMVRRMKADVLKDLPPKMRQVVDLPIDDAKTQKLVDAERAQFERHQETVAKLRAERDAAIAGGDEESYRSAVGRLKQANDIAFSEMSKVRHEVALSKAPSVIAYAKGILESKDKILIFAHHTDVIDEIMGAMGPQAVKLTGSCSQKDRQAAVDRFMTDPNCHVFVGNIKAAGVGITLTKADTVLFAELDWSPGNVTQAEDRAHRIGQTDTVNVHHLVYNGSLDSKMAKMLVAKQKVMDAALDTQHTRDWEEPDIEAVMFPGGAQSEAIAPNPTRIAVPAAVANPKSVKKAVRGSVWIYERVARKERRNAL
jgi:superfamily II DNA or RNA helicase